ncbi:NADPH:quinone oxidoreductase family protein [Candidatus Binatia bacterium]|nr:NADPH:quinone oxidoreductase family protein [Candidatus Binatia bacterium]
MRAVQVQRLEGPESISVVEIDEPKAGPGQVLIDVHAAGVTWPDLLLTRGLYQMKPPLPFVPGSEVAGVVRSAPEGSGLKPGSRVVAFPGIGAFQEVVATHPGAVFPLPERISFEAGAALPMNYLTVVFALVRRGRLKAGETVLVHGAAGGVGSAGVQVAKAFGARVLAVVSTDAKRKIAEQAGADEVVLADGFLAAVKSLTNGRGVDVVLDPVGGDRFTDSLRSLAPEGRLLVVGFTGGEIPTVKVNRLLLNNVDVVGVGLGAFVMHEPALLQNEWARLVPHLEAGRLDPPLGAVYPLADAARALTEMEERRAIGKLVLKVR